MLYLSLYQIYLLSLFVVLADCVSTLSNAGLIYGSTTVFCATPQPTAEKNPTTIHVATITILSLPFC